jgi:hypothetical protein
MMVVQEKSVVDILLSNLLIFSYIIIYMSYILDYLNNYKIKNNETIGFDLELQNKQNNYEITECSNITECYQITNECCKNINKFRQYERTKDETIVVGLELPNQEGKLIRFIPRNVNIITKQG